MYTTSLRKVGGSVMLAVPPALLDLLHLAAGTRVSLAVENGCLVVEPQVRPVYSLETLIAEERAMAEPAEADRDWLEARPVGSEVL